MDNAEAMMLRAMNRTFAISGIVKQIVVEAQPPCRAIASEVTSLVNAMRGKTDEKKRWNIAVIRAELTTPAELQPHASVTIDGVVGEVEEADFMEDLGVVTCYVS